MVKRITALFILAALVAGACVSASAAYDLPNDVYFFGDSTTAHLAVRGSVPKERVWSGAGSTMLFTSVLDKSVKIGDEMMTLDEATAKFRPKVLVITVGASGGAGFVGENRFKAIYKEMLCRVKKASPETKIVVQSILPLSDKSKKYYKKLTKQAVLFANEWIKDVCREVGVPYIDTHSLLIGENGYLRPEYQNDEYLHLTAAAYKVILKNIGENLAELNTN